MRAESFIAIKSSAANGIDVAACLPWSIRPALPGPRTRGESNSFDPAGRGASQYSDVYPYSRSDPRLQSAASSSPLRNLSTVAEREGPTTSSICSLHRRPSPGSTWVTKVTASLRINPRTLRRQSLRSPERRHARSSSGPPITSRSFKRDREPALRSRLPAKRIPRSPVPDRDAR
jgi:hypothetical protein